MVSGCLKFFQLTFDDIKMLLKIWLTSLKFMFCVRTISIEPEFEIWQKHDISSG